MCSLRCRLVEAVGCLVFMLVPTRSAWSYRDWRGRSPFQKWVTPALLSFCLGACRALDIPTLPLY